VKIPRKSYIWVGIIVLVVAIGGGIAYSQVSGSVAKVNGESISKKELDAYMLQQGGQQALEGMITEKIIEQEAKKQNIQVSDADVEKAVNETKASFVSEEEFQLALDSNGVTLDSLKRNIFLDLTVKALLEAQSPITDEQIAQYFESNKDGLGTPEQVKASHILVATEELANEVKGKLTAGEDFTALAAQYSTDESTKGQGGELGFFGRGQMVKEFEDAAFSLPVNQVSDPVKTDYGYHIIKVEEKQEAKAASLEESKDQIKEALLEQKMSQEFDSWLQGRMAEYQVDRYLDRYLG